MREKVIFLIFFLLASFLVDVRSHIVLKENYSNRIDLMDGRYFFCWNILPNSIIDIGIIAETNHVLFGIDNGDRIDIIISSFRNGKVSMEEKWIINSNTIIMNNQEASKIMDFEGEYMHGYFNLKFKKNFNTVDLTLRKITEMIFGIDIKDEENIDNNVNLIRKNIVFGQLSPTVIPSDYKYNLTLFGGSYKMYWNIINQTFFDVGIVVKGNGWVGFGLNNGTNMNSDIVTGRLVNNSFLVEDKWEMTGDSPELDVELGGKDNILEYGGGRNNSVTQMKFRRYLNTGDKYDYIIKNEIRSCVFVFNPKTDDIVNGQPNTTQISLNLFTGKTNEVMWLPILHAFLMSVGWSFFIVIGVTIACYVPKDSNKWFVIHVVFVSIGAVCILSGLIVISIHTFEKSNTFFNYGDNVVFLHQMIGILASVGCFVQIIIGIVSDRRWRKNFDMTNIKPPTSILEKIHWWLGRTSILLSVVNVYLGFHFFEPGIIWYYFFSFWWVMVVCYHLLMQTVRYSQGRKSVRHPFSSRSSVLDSTSSQEIN